METITIKVDTSLLAKALAECTEPGAVLLPVKAVQQLCLRHNVTEEQLAACGAILAAREA